MTKRRTTQRTARRFSLKPLWKRISHNGLIKILCLGMAFVVWQSVRETTSFEEVVSDIPVTVTAGEGRAVLDQSADTVSIRFRGSREDVRFISSDRIQVHIDLSERMDRLRQVVKLSPRYVKAPSRAHAVEFDPPDITVTVDRAVKRALPVRAVFEGELPQGIQLEKTLCLPASVEVRGAERLLAELEQVRTLPISFAGRSSSFKTYVALDSASQPWTVFPDHVNVEVVLVERVATRRFENSEVRSLLGSDDMRVVKIFPETVSVTVRGGPQKVAEVTARDVYTYIDCTELAEPAEYEVPVRVDVPAGLQIETIDPATVQVTVKKM